MTEIINKIYSRGRFKYDSLDLFCSWNLDCGHVWGPKILEEAKTIVELSNRFRIDGNIMCDDFMQFERPLGVQQVPARRGWSYPQFFLCGLDDNSMQHSMTSVFWL